MGVCDRMIPGRTKESPMLTLAIVAASLLLPDVPDPNYSCWTLITEACCEQSCPPYQLDLCCDCDPLNSNSWHCRAKYTSNPIVRRPMCCYSVGTLSETDWPQTGTFTCTVKIVLDCGPTTGTCVWASQYSSYECVDHTGHPTGNPCTSP